MKYNAGDKVRVKSLDWIKENCEYDEILECFIYKEEDVVLTRSMQKLCGQIVIICEIDDNTPPLYYIIKDENNLGWLFVDWMLEEIGDENET